MSSVRKDYVGEAKITYMSTRAFNSDFWSYSLSLDRAQGKYIGTLSTVSGGTSVTCPAKRFLHETGKKLFPSANPGIKTMLVGVYDPVSFLSGYIDPNSEVFLRMNNDRAANIDTLNPADNEANLRSIHGEFALRPGPDTSDYGQPVYTRGDIVALGSATITGDITSLEGDIAATVGNVTAGDSITAENNITATTGNITASAGNVNAPAGAMTAFGNITSTTGNIVSTVGSVISAKQIFNPTISDLTIVAGNTSIDVELATTFFVSSNSDFSLNARADNLYAFRGAVVRVIISNPSGGSEISVTLGTNIRELYNGTGIQTNLQTQNFTVYSSDSAGGVDVEGNVGALEIYFAASGPRNFEIPDNVTGVITFLCDGTNLLEMSRCLVAGS
jgi:hypothetical protein